MMALALLSLTLLQQIDLHCADTWCEADTDYEFKSIECDSSRQSCLLSVDVIPWGIACGRENCQRAEHRCLVDTSRFYDSIGECLIEKSERLEKLIPKPC
jgi:hypothetical protein